MVEVKTSIKKISNDKYAFVTEAEKFTRTEEVNKSVLKESYDESIEAHNKYVEELKKVNKALEESKPDNFKELEEFIELNNQAAKYNEYKKNENIQKNIVDMLKRLEKQKADIEAVCPEFKRGKK